MLATSQETSRDSKNLRQVVGWLTREFGDRVDTETIDRVAVDEFKHLQGAKVQEFIAIISWRFARARLKDLLVEQPIESL